MTLENVIGNIEKGVSTKNSLKIFGEAMTIMSPELPKNFDEALQDKNWILVMQEEMN